VALPRRRSTIFALSLVFAFACGGPTKSPQPPDPAPITNQDAPTSPSLDGAKATQVALPTIPSTPSAAPESLMAEVVLSKPIQQLAQAAAFADAVSPGIGAFVTPAGLQQMLSVIVGAGRVDGRDMDGPLVVVALDSRNVLIVVTMSSEADLRSSLEGGPLQVITHKGLAAVGTPETLRVVAPYALSNLAAQPAQALPALNLHIGKIMRGANGAETRRLMGERLRRAGTAPAVIAVVTDIVGNIGVLRTNLDASPDGATVQAVAEIEGGLIQEFLGKQRPSSFAVMDRIGTGPWGLAGGGRVDLSVFAPLLVALGEAEANPLLTQIAAQVSSLNGEMAFGLNMPKHPEFVMALDLQDPKGMAQVVNTLMNLASKKKDHDLAGMKAKIKLASIKTRAGSLHEMRAKPVTKEQIDMFGKKNVSGFFGVVVTTLIATFGNNAKAHAKKLAPASGKIAGSGSKLAAAIALAKSSRESFIVAMDTLSIQGTRPPKDVDPFVVGIGFEKTSIRARFVLPTDFVKEASKLGIF
jgi:hypothetical protein